MYQIKCDDFILYDYRDPDLIVFNPRLKLEENTVGEGSFDIYDTHPHYDKLKMLKSVFEVSDEYGVLFRGRMTGNTLDINKGKAVDLEGAMAFFNDTIVPPFNFPEDFEKDSGYISAKNGGNVIQFFLSWLIDNHNGRVQDFQKFKLGTVTVTDPNNYLSRSDANYKTTWETLKDKLFGSALGGSLCVRYEADGNYIDYLSEYTETNPQRIVYGENLLDLKSESNAGETYSAMIPTGATTETRDSAGNTVRNAVTIAGLADGNVTDDIVKEGNLIYSKFAVEQYGWICAKPEETTWEDVTDPQNLLSKAVERLSAKGIMLSNTTEYDAVDLHFTDSEIRSFRIYRKIVVEYEGETTLDLTKLDLDLLNPQNTKITVGKTRLTLTDANSKDKANTLIWVEKVEQNLKQTETDLSEVKELAENAKETADDAKNDVIVLDTKLSQEEIFNRLTNGGEIEGVYMEDGKLYINASYIKSGKIVSKDGGSFFDLETGEFVSKDTNFDWGNISILYGALHAQDLDGDFRATTGCTFDIGTGEMFFGHDVSSKDGKYFAITAGDDEVTVEAPVYEDPSQTEKNPIRWAESNGVKYLTSADSELLGDAFCGFGEPLTNSDSVSVKDVPESASSVAKVNEIGGVTRKCTNFIPFAERTYTHYGITFTVNSDGTITINGTATGTASISVTTLPLRAGESYCISSGVTSGNNQTYQMFIASNNSAFSTKYDIKLGTTFTPTADGTATVRIYVYSGTTVNNLVYKPMLNEGTEALPYEPYFEGLRSAPVSEAESIGVNLATAQAVYAGSNRYLETTLDGRSVVRFCASTGIRNEVFGFKENTQYTVSGWFKNIKTSDGNATPNAWITFFHTDGTALSSTIGQNVDWSYYTFTSSAGKTVAAVGTSSYNYTSDVYVDVNTFMLNEGATALPYVPYARNTLPIPEAVRPKHGINESVYDYIDLDKKQSVKRCREKVFDGTEEWTLQSVNANGLANFSFNGLTNASATVDSAICNLFDADYTLIAAATKEGFLISTSELVYFRSKNYSTVSDWKAYLAELYASGNPLVFVYATTTPVVTDISDLLPSDNILSVEAGGTVTMRNEYGYDVPNTVTFYLGANKMICAPEFVGNLTGIANRAVSDEYGNNIAETYAKKGEGGSSGGTVVDITSSVSVSGSNGDNTIKKAVDTGSSVLILFNGEQEFADINITFPFYLQSKLCVSAFLYGENGTVDLAAIEGLFDVQLDAFWSSYSGYGSSLKIEYV